MEGFPSSLQPSLHTGEGILSSPPSSPYKMLMKQQKSSRPRNQAPVCNYQTAPTPPDSLVALAKQSPPGVPRNAAPTIKAPVASEDPCRSQPGPCAVSSAHTLHHRLLCSTQLCAPCPRSQEVWANQSPKNTYMLGSNPVELINEPFSALLGVSFKYLLLQNPTKMNPFRRKLIKSSN